MKKILLSLIIINTMYAQINFYDLDNYIIQRDSISYSSNSMLKSLIFPGWGQLQNNDPIWKPLAFIAFEVAGLTFMTKYNKRADDIRKDFESFADKHWTLERWYNNTKLIFPQKWKNILVGTHKLELMINGDYFKTDQLVDLKEKYSWNDILVIRDRDFYENIGKYDQFVGGWDDPFDNPFDAAGMWYTIKKGNVESIILTKQKDYYRGLRDDSNILKLRAKNAVYTVMLNHLISGLEAGLKSKREPRFSPRINFYYSSLDPYGVQGVKISYEW